MIENEILAYVCVCKGVDASASVLHKYLHGVCKSDYRYILLYTYICMCVQPGVSYAKILRHNVTPITQLLYCKHIYIKIKICESSGRKLCLVGGRGGCVGRGGCGRLA